MNKALTALALFTLGTMAMAAATVFGGFNIYNATASVLAGVGEFTKGGLQTGEQPPPILAVQNVAIEDIATATDAAKDSEEDTEDEEEEGDEEPPMPIDDWRIFYTQSDFEGAHAYTLRYPLMWVIDDTDPHNVVLKTDAGNMVHSLSFLSEPVNTSGLGKLVSATSTDIGEAEYVKRTYAQGAMTFLTYTPKNNPRAFSTALAVSPSRRAEEYIEVYERVLSTLAVEPARYPFTISDVQVNLGGPMFTTATAIAEPFTVLWKVADKREFDRESATLGLWVEDEGGNTIRALGSPRLYNAESMQFMLPPEARQELVFGQRYRVVAKGEARGEKTNKAYSDWFTVLDVEQFAEPRLKVTPSTGTAPLHALVEASVRHFAGPNYAYIAFFGNGTYSILEEGGEEGKFKGEWTRMYTLEGGKEQTVYLMRTTTDALQNKFYGAQTYEDMLQYADEILRTTVSLE